MYSLGAPAAALGLIEGISECLGGAGRFVGGALADDPRRRTIAVGGYTVTAVLSGLIGWPAVWWTALGLRNSHPWWQIPYRHPQYPGVPGALPPSAR